MVVAVNQITEAVLRVEIKMMSGCPFNTLIKDQYSILSS